VADAYQSKDFTTSGKMNWSAEQAATNKDWAYQHARGLASNLEYGRLPSTYSGGGGSITGGFAGTPSSVSGTTATKTAARPASAIGPMSGGAKQRTIPTVQTPIPSRYREGVKPGLTNPQLKASPQLSKSPNITGAAGGTAQQGPNFGRAGGGKVGGIDWKAIFGGGQNTINAIQNGLGNTPAPVGWPFQSNPTPQTTKKSSGKAEGTWGTTYEQAAATPGFSQATAAAIDTGAYTPADYAASYEGLDWMSIRAGLAVQPPYNDYGSGYSYGGSGGGGSSGGTSGASSASYQYGMMNLRLSTG